MRQFDEAFAAYAVAVALEFCRVRGWELSTLGHHAVGDAKFFVKLFEDNYGASLARYTRAMNYLITNWPPGAVRPARPPWPFIWPEGASNGKASEEGRQRGSNGKAAPRKEARRPGV